MQPASPRSAAVFTNPANQPTRGHCCLSRTVKLAIAIFASLAAFVFLPFGVALAISASVTLGLIICCSKEKGSQDVVPTRRTSISHIPTEIVILCGQIESIEHSHTVCVDFKTNDALQQFVRDHQEKFGAFANFEINATDRSVHIDVKLEAREEKSALDIKQILVQIFGEQAVSNAICFM